MTAQLIERLTAVLQARPEVAVAYLYGSEARGSASDLSDVDVAVLLDEPDVNRLRYRAQLAEDLTRAADGRRVQVLDVQEASPLLAHRVVRDGRLLVDRDVPRRVRFVARTLIRFLDTERLRADFRRTQAAAIREGRFYG